MREWLYERAVEDMEAEAEKQRGEAGGAPAAAAAVAAPPARWRRLLCLGAAKGKKRPTQLPAALRAELDARCANVYDVGLFKNFREAFSGRSQQRRPAAAPQQAAKEGKAE